MLERLESLESQQTIRIDRFPGDQSLSAVGSDMRASENAVASVSGDDQRVPQFLGLLAGDVGVDDVYEWIGLRQTTDDLFRLLNIALRSDLDFVQRPLKHGGQGARFGRFRAGQMDVVGLGAVVQLCQNRGVKPSR